MGYQVKMPHGTMHYGLPPDVVLPPGALPPGALPPGALPPGALLPGAPLPRAAVALPAAHALPMTPIAVPTTPVALPAASAQATCAAHAAALRSRGCSPMCRGCNPMYGARCRPAALLRLRDAGTLHGPPSRGDGDAAVHAHWGGHDAPRHAARDGTPHWGDAAGGLRGMFKVPPESLRLGSARLRLLRLLLAALGVACVACVACLACLACLACTPSGRARATGRPVTVPQVLERATSRVADLTTFDSPRLGYAGRSRRRSRRQPHPSTRLETFAHHATRSALPPPHLP